MSLNPGSQLGPFEILSAIGAGGMGEVYRARDTKLGRDVAIKVLPEEFVADADRRARWFEREARLLASLNHPHIAAIHGIEQVDGVQALVLELIEGETLHQRLIRGPLPVAEALRYANEIAEINHAKTCSKETRGMSARWLACSILKPQILPSWSISSRVSSSRSRISATQADLRLNDRSK